MTRKNMFSKSLHLSALACASAAALGLGGCASNYKAPEGKPLAKLDFAVSTDSTRTTLVVTRILAYADLDCKPNPAGELIEKRYQDPVEVFNTIDIPANEPFTFAIWYSEARFAQNRECSYTAQFTPQEGRQYRANMELAGDMSSCRMNIEDRLAPQPSSVSFRSPQNSCAETLFGIAPNGQPTNLLWKIKVDVVPR